MYRHTTLQHTAKHFRCIISGNQTANVFAACNILQHTATRTHRRQHNARHYNTLHHTEVPFPPLSSPALLLFAIAFSSYLLG